MEHDQETRVVRTGEWMVTLLVAAIPIINIIMMFVWAFGDGSNPSKANWAKAGLIWWAIVIGLYLLIFVVIGATFFSAFQ